MEFETDYELEREEELSWLEELEWQYDKAEERRDYKTMRKLRVEIKNQKDIVKLFS